MRSSPSLVPHASPESPARAARVRARPGERPRAGAGSSGRRRSRSLSERRRLQRAPLVLRALPPARPQGARAAPAHPALAADGSAVLGGVALLVFAVLFLRLWSLQVLSGDEYLNAAQNNQLRLVRVEAPRGPIVDRHGRAIVSNVAGTAVQLWIGDMPKEGRHELVRRLAQGPQRPPGRSRARWRSVAAIPDPDHREELGRRGAGQLPVRASGRVPRESRSPRSTFATTSTTRSQLTSSATSARSRRRSSSGSEGRLPRGRPHRQGGHRGRVRHVPPRRGRPRPDPRRLARGRSQRSSCARSRERDTRSGSRWTFGCSVRPRRRSATGSTSRTRPTTGPRTAARSSRSTRDDGAVLAMASAPTYKPSVYVGRIDPKKLEPLLDEEAARRANYPGLNRATAGLYPPGSTWKPVTALAGMQEHVFSAYESLQCSPVAYYGLDRQRFQNWNPYRRPADDARRGARRILRHLLLRDRRSLLPARQGRAVAHAAVGAPVRLRPGDGARHRRRGRGPAPDARLALEDVRERLGSRLEPGRLDPALDRPEGPARDPAPDGRVLRDARQRRRRRHAVRRLGRRAAGREGLAAGRPPPLRASASPRSPASTRLRSTPSATASIWPRTRRVGTSSGVFANYAVPISGKTGTAEKVVQLPGYPSDHLEDQSWWCGWGPSDDAKIVVCALIENGGHGSTAAAPAALRVFERFFSQKAPSTVLRETD